MFRHIVFVGHHNDGAPLIVQPLKEGEDLLGGDRVQISGRFIGEDEIRIVDEAASDGDTLLLATGQLRRLMAKSVPKSYHCGEFFAELARFRI